MIVVAAPDDSFALESELVVAGISLPTPVDFFRAFNIPLNEVDPFDSENLWTVKVKHSRASTRVVNANTRKTAKRVKASPERLEQLTAFYAAQSGSEISPFED